MRGEKVNNSYDLKNNKWKNGLRLMVWAAISYTGPLVIYFP
jgi:hypothetical protein